MKTCHLLLSPRRRIFLPLETFWLVAASRRISPRFADLVSSQCARQGRPNACRPGIFHLHSTHNPFSAKCARLAGGVGKWGGCCKRGVSQRIYKHHRAFSAQLRCTFFQLASLFESVTAMVKRNNVPLNFKGI